MRLTILLLLILFTTIVSAEVADDGHAAAAAARDLDEHGPPHDTPHEEEGKPQDGKLEESLNEAAPDDKDESKIHPDVLNDLADSETEGMDAERQATVVSLLALYFAAPLIGFGYIFFLCIKNGTCDVNDIFEKSYDDKKK